MVTTTTTAVATATTRVAKGSDERANVSAAELDE
jgi:hypothetical protein